MATFIVELNYGGLDFSDTVEANNADDALDSALEWIAAMLRKHGTVTLIEGDTDDWCKVCGGTGEVENDDYTTGTCDWCDGSGTQGS